MSGNPLPSKASAKFLDYVGLGLILMVIEVFGARWFEGQTISRGQWITGGFLMLAGAIFVAVGTWWDKVNPPPAGRFAPSFDGLVHHARTEFWRCGLVHQRERADRGGHGDGNLFGRRHLRALDQYCPIDRHLGPL